MALHGGIFFLAGNQNQKNDSPGRSNAANEVDLNLKSVTDFFTDFLISCRFLAIETDKLHEGTNKGNASIKAISPFLFPKGAARTTGAK